MEYDAAEFLHTHADQGMIRELSTPSVTGGTLDAISTAIDNRRTTGSVLISNVGRTTERDSLPQAVDYLVRLEGVQTAIVFGIVNDTIYLSARSPDARVHVGNILHDAFKDVGSGGGHLVLTMVVLWFLLAGLIEVGTGKLRDGTDQKKVREPAREATRFFQLGAVIAVLLLLVGGLLVANGLGFLSL
jgi:hypothetical protein